MSNKLEDIGFEPCLCDDYEGLPKDANREDWIIEPKLDGVRCIVVLNFERDRPPLCSIYTRSGQFITSVEHIAFEILSHFIDTQLLLKRIVIDGELWSPELPFDAISGLVRQKNTQSPSIQLHCFDCIWQSPQDIWLQSLPLKVRRRSLMEWIPETKSVKHVLPIAIGSNSVDTVLKWSVDNGYEGIVIKNIHSAYKFGRSRFWLKHKPLQTAQFTVTGFYEGEGEMQGMIGALRVRFTNPDQSSVGSLHINSIHKVGTGFDKLTRALWYESPALIMGAVIEVSFQSVTIDGNLRFPSFVRIISHPHTHE